MSTKGSYTYRSGPSNPVPPWERERPASTNTEPGTISSPHYFLAEVLGPERLLLKLPYYPEPEEILSVTVRGLVHGDSSQFTHFYDPAITAFSFDRATQILTVCGADFQPTDQIEVTLVERPLPITTAINHQALNEELRQRSGAVTSPSSLVAFLYDLMRDHLTPGVVEELARVATIRSGEVLYTNGYLARYAEDVAKRLLGQPGSGSERNA